MFTMALLRGILLFSVITVSCQALLVTTNVSDTPSAQPCSQTVNTSDDILVLKVQMKKMEMKIVELEKVANKTGSIFTRWGRIDCPSNISQLVYSGIAGGAHHHHTGGAVDYVCLPPDPSFNENKFPKAFEEGYMYGAEYESNPRQGLQNYKVPCAVCRTSQFSTVLMIPAKSECYTGWQKAYHGELGSGKYLHNAASQFICLDYNPQTNGTNENGNGKLLYPVRARCGKIPCPPYAENALLTCVVCLK